MRNRRADATLVELGYFESREKAKAAIMAGEVKADGEPVRKAGQPLDPSADISVADVPRYVSRGGHKLAGALDAFGYDPSGVRAIDVGASTGGFTDCLLQRGASHVTAVDVGYGQLAWSLRNDERVTVHERTNVREADPEDLGAPFDLAVVDVSFIGLRKVLPTVFAALHEEGDVFALVKPQFEAGRSRVGGGVVRDPAVHADVLSGVVEWLHEEDWIVRGLIHSPLPGPKGNIEFWVWTARYGDETSTGPRDVVDEAHERLGGG